MHAQLAKGAIPTLLGVSLILGGFLILAFADSPPASVESDSVTLQMDSDGLYHVVGVPCADW